MNSHNRKFLEKPYQFVFAMILIVAVVFIARLHWYTYNYEMLREKYNKFKKCFQKETDGKDANAFWDKFGTATNICATLLGLNIPRLQGFKNKDETKYHILPIDPSSDSIIISLGIGHDAEAEKVLKPALSEGSLFIGVDPDITNHDIYREVGTFLPMAVGKNSGNVTVDHLFILGKSGYASKSTFMITLSALFKEYLPKKTRVIDDIWVDIEHSEYEIVDFFYNSASVLREGYSICQFNFEAHSPNDHQKIVFYNFIKQLLEDQRFAFLKVTSVAGHWRIFFVDYLDKHCTDKYLLEG